jgi:drug/metabolite transporter (DMT)-like permease
MIYIPFLGAIALSAGTILEKLLLKKKKLEVTLYQTASFLSIILLMVPLLFFFWKMDSGAWELKNILIFLGVIASAVIANFLALYALKWEKVTNTEPARILEPMLVIVLAIIFNLFIQGFQETNIKLVIPALIAAVALIFPHIKKHHLRINKYILAAIFGSFFFALELVLSKLILDLYSPISFYFLRCLFVFLMSLILFRPDFKILNKKISFNILIIGLVWIVYRIAIYFGYMKYGIIFTTLIVMISPIMIYIFAGRFLKEKLNWKNILSSVIIIACVVYSLFS